MIDVLAKRYVALEDRRLALVARVRAMPPEKRMARPDPSSFAALEVVEHFALVEHFNMVFLDRAAPSTLGGQRPALRMLGKYVMKGMQNPERGMPTLPQAEPQGSLVLDESASKWEGARWKLKRYLDEVTDPDAAFIKMAWMFGTLSATMYLDLVEAHMAYHEKRLPAG